MIHRSSNHYRTAAFIFAAVALSTVAATRTEAQTLTNLFGGSTGAITVAGTPALISVGTPATATTTGTLGSGYAGTVTVNNGVGSTLSETLNATAGTLTAQAGGVISLGGTFDAVKTFTTAGLQPSTAYQFSITKASGSTLSLLTGLNFTFAADGTQIANTATGFGILGGLSVNALGLFNTTNTVTFTFTTPATITPNSNLTFDTTGQIGANSGLLGATTFTLSNASVTPAPVPEPGTMATALVSMVGLAAWRARRSLGAV